MFENWNSIICNFHIYFIWKLAWTFQVRFKRKGKYNGSGMLLEHLGYMVCFLTNNQSCRRLDNFHESQKTSKNTNQLFSSNSEPISCMGMRFPVAVTGDLSQVLLWTTRAVGFHISTRVWNCRLFLQFSEAKHVVYTNFLCSFLVCVTCANRRFFFCLNTIPVFLDTFFWKVWLLKPSSLLGISNDPLFGRMDIFWTTQFQIFEC